MPLGLICPGDALDPRRFGFIDPPPEDAMEMAIINLKQVCGEERVKE
jgi:hypothetical protein